MSKKASFGYFNKVLDGGLIILKSAETGFTVTVQKKIKKAQKKFG